VYASERRLLEWAMEAEEQLTTRETEVEEAAARVEERMGAEVQRRMEQKRCKRELSERGAREE
jgi:hypothetical protein